MTPADMPVAIIAGGLATRLRPITEQIPKSLVEVAGEPFLGHQLRLLRRSGIRKVVICAGYLAGHIEEFAGDGSRFDLEIRYSLDGDQLRGTGGALQSALPLLGSAFLTLYGDSYLPVDYLAVARYFLGTSKQGLMTVFRNNGRWNSSNVEFGDGRILTYDKRICSERMEHIDYGLGAFRSAAFDLLRTKGPQDLASLYQDLLARDQLAAFEVHERYYEVGSLSGIDELNSYLTQ